jgi:hypothetical protein
MKSVRLWLAASLMIVSGSAESVWGQNAAPPTTPATPVASDERYTEEATSSAARELERQKIWDSPEMVEAREWLVDHMARSARITPSQSKRYMDELERLNAQQLKLWLIAFEEQQAERARQSESFERARQQSVENAMRQNEARQQSGQNINRTRDEAARMAQETMADQQRESQKRSRQLVSDRDAAARAALEPSSYIWLNTLPWGPYAGYPVNGGAAIDPAAYQGVLGVENRQPRGTVAPGSGQGLPPVRTR